MSPLGFAPPAGQSRNRNWPAADRRRGGPKICGRRRQRICLADSHVEAAKAMSVRELKAKMEQAGLSTAGIFEKSEMVTQVAELLAKQPAAQPAAEPISNEPVITGDPDVLKAKLQRSRLGFAGAAYLLIELSIKGNLMTFLVDTGASLSIITKATRDKLGYGPNEGSVSLGSTAASGVEQARVLRMTNVLIDNKPCPDFDAACTEFDTSSLPGLAGLVGLNFLLQFDVVVDADREEAIWFYPHGSLASGRYSTVGMHKTRFSRTVGVGLMKVPAVLKRAGTAIQLEALFDLGSGDKVLNKNGARALGASESDLIPRSSSESAMSMDGSTIAGVRLGVDELELGGVSVGPTSLLVADMPIFSNPMIFDRNLGSPALIAGLSALENRVVAFDFKAQLIYLS